MTERERTKEKVEYKNEITDPVPERMDQSPQKTFIILMIKF